MSRVVLLKDLLTRSQAASHCSGYDPLTNASWKSKKKKTQTNTKPHQNKQTKTPLLFMDKITDRWCSLLTNLFRKLWPDCKSSPAKEMLKNISSFLSFFPTVFYLSWFRWAGEHSNWKRNPVKNKNKRRPTPTPPEVSGNISITFCNLCI